jgi:hypothetical protein
MEQHNSMHHQLLILSPLFADHIKVFFNVVLSELIGDQPESWKGRRFRRIFLVSTFGNYA